MWFLYFLFYVFLIVSMIDVLHFGFFLVGANYYDIRNFRQGKEGPKRRKHRSSPQVSVLIPAYNEEKTIIRCLESIRTNTYRKWEVIVINDASSDNTRRVVADYIAKNPSRNIRLVNKRVNGGKAKALNYALRNHVRGELVMTLDADSALGRHTISNSVRHFNNPSVVGVAANVRVMDGGSFVAMLQKFEYMVSYRSKKFYTVTNSEFIVGGVASTYRRDVMKQVGYYDDDIWTEDIALSMKIVAEGNRANRIIYASDVTAYTEGVQTFSALLKQRYRWKMGSLQTLLKYRQLLGNRSRSYSRMLTFYRLPMSFLGEFMLLMQPLVLAFVIYASFKIASPVLLVAAWITISLYLIWSIWPDEHLPWRRKLRLTAYIPVLYFAFYALSVVQFTAMVHCVINHRQVRRQSGNTSHWISPERQGQVLAAEA